MSIQTILAKIAAITDGGKNTAFEMRSILTDITETFSGSTNIPAKTSDLDNDGNGIDPFITSGAVPTNVSELNNDSAFVTSGAIPTNLSSFVNDGDGTGPYLTTVNVYGGNVVLDANYYHIQDYDYYTYAKSWVIGGNLYTIASGITDTVTLSGGSSLDRIDVITITTGNTFNVVQGAPDVNPSKPDIDTTSEVELTFVYVKAFSTAPDDVFNETLYNENLGTGGGEWNVGVSSAQVNPDYSGDAQSGTKSIAFSAVTSGDYVDFTNTSAVSGDDLSNIIFRIKLLNVAPHRLSIRAYNTNNGFAGLNVTIDSGQYGFNASLLNEWQTIIIPKTVMNVAGQTYNRIRLFSRRSGVIFLVDNVIAQEGTIFISTGPTITRTSQIANDGSDGENPYLDQLTLTANTTVSTLINKSEYVLGSYDNVGYGNIVTIGKAVGKLRLTQGSQFFEAVDGHDFEGGNASDLSSLGWYWEATVFDASGNTRYISVNDFTGSTQGEIWQVYSGTSYDGLVGTTWDLPSGDYEFYTYFLPEVDPTKEFAFSLGYSNKATGDYSVAIGYNSEATGTTAYAEGNRTLSWGYASHAEGYLTKADGNGAHSEGFQTEALNQGAHSEGYSTKAHGLNAHAEGFQTEATGHTTHAEGWGSKAYGDYSHAEGNFTTALGPNSHAEGNQAQATGNTSHAEGIGSIAGGLAAHAEGNYTIAQGTYSHAEGQNSIASGQSSHAEGGFTNSGGLFSHAEGYNTRAIGTYSHAEGWETRAVADYSHAEGSNTRATGNYSHAEGQNSIASGWRSHAEGTGTFTQGTASHAEGSNTQALGDYSHSEGNQTIASGQSSHASGVVSRSGGLGSFATGYDTRALGVYSFTKGFQTRASGDYSNAQGRQTIASGDYSNAQGYLTQAIGNYSNAIGYNTRATGGTSHAEGENTLAGGSLAHAEGYDTKALGNYTHTEGWQTQAIGDYSHAEGRNAITNGDYSHAEGRNTTAEGFYSHVQGYENTAYGMYSHVGGTWATLDSSALPSSPADTDHLVKWGNGINSGSRSDAFILRRDGLLWLPTVTNTMIDTGSTKSVITKEWFTANTNSISYGLDNEIPVMNATNDGFEYSSGFTYNYGQLSVGVDGIIAGSLNIYGEAINGSFIRLYNSDLDDSIVDSYFIRADDDFIIQTNSGGDILRFDTTNFALSSPLSTLSGITNNGNKTLITKEWFSANTSGLTSDLQGVLDTGGYSQSANAYNFIDIVQTEGSAYIEMYMSAGGFGTLASGVYHQNDYWGAYVTSGFNQNYATIECYNDFTSNMTSSNGNYFRTQWPNPSDFSSPESSESGKGYYFQGKGKAVHPSNNTFTYGQLDFSELYPFFDIGQQPAFVSYKFPVSGGTVSIGGTYDATNNIPILSNSIGLYEGITQREGMFFIVVSAGTQDFGNGDITFGVGDRVEWVNGEWIKTVDNNPLEENIKGTAIYDNTFSGATNVDLNAASAGRFILTGNTTITFTNTPSTGETIVRTYLISSTTTETLGIANSTNEYGAYVADGTLNKLIVEAANYPTVGLVIDVQFLQPN